MTSAGKEQAREIADSGKEAARRLRNRFGGTSKEIDATDAFSLPSSGSPFDMPALDIDPFKSAFFDIEFKQLGTPLVEKNKARKLK